MLRTETIVIAEWYDFEAVRAFSVRCDCGLAIPDDALERLTDEPYLCLCGKKIKVAELDALGDSLEWRISELTQH